MLNYRGGKDVSVLAEAEVFMSGVRGRSGIRFTSDAPPYPSRHGMGVPGRVKPPSTPREIPPLPGFLPEYNVRDLVPGRGIMGTGNEPDQPTGPFCAPPRVGHTCDPGGG